MASLAPPTADSASFPAAALALRNGASATGTNIGPMGSASDPEICVG